MRQLPVALISGMRGSSTNASPTSRAPIATCSRSAGASAEAGDRLVEDRLTGERADRRLVGRLPDHRVAADDGEREVPRPGRDRKIEGGDDADRPERVPGLHHAVTRPLGGDGQAIKLARQADGEVADVDHLLDLALALLEDLAALDGDDLAQRVLVRAQLLGEQAHQLAALGSGHRTPDIEGGDRAADHDVDGSGCILGEAGDGAAVDRRSHRKALFGAQGLGIEPKPGGEVWHVNHGVKAP